jgi:hypothetical protein
MLFMPRTGFIIHTVLFSIIIIPDAKIGNIILFAMVVHKKLAPPRPVDRSAGLQR